MVYFKKNWFRTNIDLIDPTNKFYVWGWVRGGGCLGSEFIPEFQPTPFKNSYQVTGREVPITISGSYYHRPDLVQKLEVFNEQHFQTPVFVKTYEDPGYIISMRCPESPVSEIQSVRGGLGLT